MNNATLIVTYSDGTQEEFPVKITEFNADLNAGTLEPVFHGFKGEFSLEGSVGCEMSRKTKEFLEKKLADKPSKLHCSRIFEISTNAKTN